MDLNQILGYLEIFSEEILGIIKYVGGVHFSNLKQTST